MIDPSHAGLIFPPFQYEISRAKIRELALVIGDPNLVYHDVAAAQAAGFPDLVAPPTLSTLCGLWPSDTILAHLQTIGLDLNRALHAEEEYEYLAPMVPGDLLTGVMRLTDVRIHKHLEFLTLETTYTNQRNELTARARTLVVQRWNQS